MPTKEQQLLNQPLKSKFAGKGTLIHFCNTQLYPNTACYSIKGKFVKTTNVTTEVTCEQCLGWMKKKGIN